MRGFDPAPKNFQHLAEILQGHPDLAAHVRILDQDFFGLTWNGTAIKDVTLSIVAICPNLHHAQMRVPEGDQVEEMALAMRKKSQLRTLAVVIDVEQDGLSSWTPNVGISHLETLSLGMAHERDPRARFPTVPPQLLVSVASIAMNRIPWGLTYQLLPAPGHISTLTSFKIEFDAAPVAQSITPLMGYVGPHLEKLRIEDRTGRSTNSELPLELFSSLSKLETFVVETGGGMTLEMLEALSVGSPRLSALDTTSRVWSGSAIESAEAWAHRACSILTSMEALKTVSIVVDDFGKWESAATLEQLREVLAPRVVLKWEVTRRRQQVEEYMSDDDYGDDSERSYEFGEEDEAAEYLRWSEERKYWGDD